ncbi:MAG: hypothetical protein LUH05_04940 [Candidatus Gastranaerophilales bacterium]|nr:hypothetical protein [Candidatus Gastranaerophilales bacterium]
MYELYASQGNDIKKINTFNTEIEAQIKEILFNKFLTDKSYKILKLL